MITLKTLPQATEQEVFDQVVLHVVKQGKPSLDLSGEHCAYRGSDGLKCAAGCLIGADEYTPNMEGESWMELDQVPENHKILIRRLQRWHDEAAPYANFVNRFLVRAAYTAAEYGLTMPEIPVAKD